MLNNKNQIFAIISLEQFYLTNIIYNTLNSKQKLNYKIQE